MQRATGELPYWPTAMTVPFTNRVDPHELIRRGPETASILIAEDNPDSRDALRSLLEAYGFHVLEAENGQEAVKKALRFRPDLVLMDIMMPVMDGLNATRILRSSPEFRQVPIIALTAMAGARQLALDAGCDDHLPKPIDIPALVETIRGLLNTH
jgi:two-component system cell cycle response regulator DivK